MIILQFLWLNFVLVFITSGYTVTATVLYAISIVYFVMLTHTLNQVHSSISSGDKDTLFKVRMMYEFYPMGIKNVIPITCSAMVHGFITLFLMGNPLLSIAIVVTSMFRVYNSEKLENVLWQK